MQRRHIVLSLPTLLSLPAWAHHGWSSFDQTRPIYLEGQATQVAWRNPHAELKLTLPASGLKLPSDLATRTLPAQSANVDGPALMKAATLPKRQDKTWEIELAPITRLQAWAVPEIKAGDNVAMLGFTFTGEQGSAILRVEYLFWGGKTYGLRSSPV
jgi:Family of unknown function (DUF6152)